MAGVRWNLALGGFRGFEADDRLESCRRLVATSCLGREGRRPPTALVEIQDLAVPAPTDVFVIATGYNDWHANFAAHARLVLDAARAKGFDTIAWVTYRENVAYQLPSSSEVAVSSYAVMNDELDKLKTSIGIGGGGQTVTINITSTRENLVPAMEIVADILRSPSFPEAEFTKLRDELLAGIDQARSDPQSIAARAKKVWYSFGVVRFSAPQ